MDNISSLHLLKTINHASVKYFTWVSLTVVSMLWRMAQENVAVLPVPD